MKSKKQIKKENTEELRTLKAKFRLEVIEFTSIHLRVIGTRVVNYWPSTGKAWAVGDPGPVEASPAEVCAMAMDDWGKHEEEVDMHEINVAALTKWKAWREMSPHGPLSKLGLRRVTNQLSKMDHPDIQMASVDQSIHHGWRGLFPPRGAFAVQVDLTGVEFG